MAEACREGDAEGGACLAEPSPRGHLTHGTDRSYQGISCVPSGSAPLSLLTAFQFKLMEPSCSPDLKKKGSLCG